MVLFLGVFQTNCIG